MRRKLAFTSLLCLAIGCGNSPDDAPEDAAIEDAGSQSPPDSGFPDMQADAAQDAESGGHDAAPPCTPDGLAELCDGLDNDCNAATADGSGDPNLGGSCDGADGDLCAEGVTVCRQGAASCDDASDDTIDACDGKDNDCDGEADEACSEASFPILDFDVDAAGAAVAVGTVGNKLRVMCFGPDGSVLRDAFDAAEPEVVSHNFLSVQVARARDAGNVSVAFTYRPSNLDWRNYVAFFDRSCQLVSGRQVLDSVLANSGLNRRLDVRMTDSGATYVLYEHDDDKKFRVLAFDSQGARVGSVTLTRPSECAGDGRPGRLALNEQSGDFAVFCEGSSTRNFKRFAADGTLLDATIRAVPDSTPEGFSFYYWGAAMNRRSELLYFGRNAATQWLLQPFDAQGAAGADITLQGTTGGGSPRAEETSQGNFLLELGGVDYQLALLSPSGTVLDTWPSSPGLYRLDAQDHVYVVEGQGIVRSRSIELE
jgi:hypothetical protein